MTPTVVDVHNLAVGNKTFMICRSGKERKSLKEKFLKNFHVKAVDMFMIDHTSENGVDSLKIEGRMKSIHYVSNSNKLLQGSC